MTKIFHDAHSIYVNSEKNNSFTLEYYQKDSCPVCGEPNQINKEKECHIFTHFFDFKLVFGGYYYTDFNNKPLNKWGKLINDLEDPLTAESNLILDIFKYRLQLLDEIKKIKWVTWIPSTNVNSIDIFKKIISIYNWEIIDPIELMYSDLNIKTKRRDRKYTVKKKYTRRKILPTIIDRIEKKVGGIFDDFYFSGSTMNQFLSFSENLQIPSIFGITLGKIPHHKLRPITFYPS